MKKIRLSFNQWSKINMYNKKVRVTKKGEVYYIERDGDDYLVTTWGGTVQDDVKVIDDWS